ncbi:MAG: GNAT family N-acetyltransferase [Woeseia sp.]
MEQRKRTQVIFEHGLSEAHLNDAAELYESAFGHKLSRAIPNQADRVSLISGGFESEFAITAIDDNRLVGLAGYHTSAGSLTSGISGRSIIGKLGLIRGGWACLFLNFYERAPAPGELLMDGIAVHPDYRGCGIGTELLRRIVSCASENSYTTVRLDVVDTNAAARRLYEQFGFEVTSEKSYPLLAGILGFGGSATMEYRIAQ